MFGPGQAQLERLRQCCQAGAEAAAVAGAQAAVAAGSAVGVA